MSSREGPDHGSGRLFASRNYLHTDTEAQPTYKNRVERDTFDYASIPRHRIAGKPRMPPYIEAPTIKVPEPRRQARSKSRERKRNEAQTVSGDGKCFSGRSGIGEICVSANGSMEVQEPVFVNDALVMVVPKSYLPPVTPIPSVCSSNKGKSFKVNGKSKGHSVSLPVESSKFDKSYGHILSKKVPPTYIPRPCHQMESTEWDSDTTAIENSESDDENNTPWGKRISAIKVSRVKRDYEEDMVSIDTPEGSLPVCARCGGAVYLAEERRAAKRSFHSSCFKCFLCRSSLDSVNLYERNQEIYCKSCYIRQFGPKGYDYGPGEGALKIE